jgi:hypothetical protein
MITHSGLEFGAADGSKLVPVKAFSESSGSAIVIAFLFHSTESIGPASFFREVRHASVHPPRQRPDQRFLYQTKKHYQSNVLSIYFPRCQVLAIPQIAIQEISVHEEYRDLLRRRSVGCRHFVRRSG